MGGPLQIPKPSLTDSKEVNGQKKPKKAIFLYFLLFFGIFSYIWPLARPNIAKKGAAIGEKGPGRVRDGFGWLRDGFGEPLILKCWFLAPQAPETSIWAPEGAFGPKKAIFN